MTAPTTGPRPGDLIRRLRAWPHSSWEHGDRVAVTRLALQALADLAAAAEGRGRRLVPSLHTSALADQLAVLFDDAVAEGAAGDAAPVLSALAIELGLN